MKEATAKQLLRNPDQQPDETVLKSILDRETFGIMDQITNIISEANIDFGWRYYKDGKAWLGKAAFKKKTIVWISVWDGFIKASFYFTPKTRPNVLTLDIDEKVKSEFATKEPVGKLIPLIIDVKDKETLQDFMVLLNHKRNLR